LVIRRDVATMARWAPRNELLELQYAPTTKTAYETPPGLSALINFFDPLDSS
jgi:hypothetical protein